MKEIVFFGVLLVSFFVFPLLPFNTNVLLMPAVETFLFLLFGGNRQWKILCTFFVLSLIFDWAMNGYADVGIQTVTAHLGISNPDVAYFCYVALFKSIIILLEGILLGWMTEFNKQLWLSLVFINLFSPVVCFLLDRFHVLESIRGKIEYLLGKTKES